MTAAPPGPDRRSAVDLDLVIVTPGGEHGGGGMGTVSHTIAAWLRHSRPGTTVTVTDPRGDGPGWRWPLHFIRAAWQLATAPRRHRLRILHLQVSERSSFIRKGLLLELGRRLGYRTVLHHHGAELIPFYRRARRPMRGWVRRCVARADVNIVLGDGWKEFVVDELGAAPARVRVLANASGDLGFVTRPVTGQPTHFLLMANLSARKGVGDFLLALQSLARSGRPVRATLAGGGEVEQFRAQAAEMGLGEIVTFTGWVNRAEAAQLLLAADVLVLPSYNEGLPMVILEALSAGLPVIATPVGSIPEVLTDRRDCLLVTPGDTDGLAAGMRWLVDSPELRRSLALRGRELFEHRFTIGDYMASLLAIYAEGQGPVSAAEPLQGDRHDLPPRTEAGPA